MRVTSSLWVAAHVRRCFAAGAFAVVERKGAEEAGAIFVRVDMPGGSSKLFLPAPMAAYEQGSHERKWEACKGGETFPSAEAAQILARESRMDPDIWIIAIDDREGRCFLPEDLIV